MIETIREHDREGGVRRRCRLGAWATAAVVLCVHGAAAWAGDVTGEIKFEPRKLGSPPERNQGFIERVENPLRPVKGFDPYPYMVVVLEGELIDDEAKKPPPGTTKYKLLGESFDVPLFAVVAGTRVELENRSGREVVLDTPEDPQLVDAVIMKPKSSHELKIAEPHKVVTVRSQSSVHLRGKIVTFSHRYFSLVDGRGRFAIKDVPEGNWKVRVWYREAWLEGVEQSFEVNKRRGGEVTVTLAPNVVRQSGKQE